MPPQKNRATVIGNIPKNLVKILITILRSRIRVTTASSCSRPTDNKRPHRCCHLHRGPKNRTVTVRRYTLLHTHPFNGSFSETTRVSWYQKGKTNLDFTEARGSEWQWHQLGHKQVCISLQTHNHASTPPLKFFTDRMPFLPPNQQRQSTEGNRSSSRSYSSRNNSTVKTWFVDMMIH